jgi:hypothetical protein
VDGGERKGIEEVSRRRLLKIGRVVGSPRWSSAQAGGAEAEQCGWESVGGKCDCKCKCRCK